MTFNFSSTLHVDGKLRSELSKPFGKVLTSATMAKAVDKNARIFAVGDVTVSTLLKLGYDPVVAIFDYRSERTPRYFPIIRRHFSHPIKIKNARGELSRALWDSVRKAAMSRRHVGIRIAGEEDLASLACIHFARNGDLVMYGMRNRGIAVIRVNLKIKRYVVNVLKKMSAKRNDY